MLPTDPDFPPDYSAGDIRYSSISWCVLVVVFLSLPLVVRPCGLLSLHFFVCATPRAIGVTSTFALGPSVVDPRSGEILNADIVFTHGWINSYLRCWELLHVGRVQSTSETVCTAWYRDFEDTITSSQAHGHRGHAHKKRHPMDGHLTEVTPSCCS